MNREKLIWTIIFVIGVGALGWRFFTTNMSMTYVAGTDYEFVEVGPAQSSDAPAQPSDKDAKTEPETRWVNLAEDPDLKEVQSGQEKVIKKLEPWTTYRDISMEVLPIQSAFKSAGLDPSLVLDPVDAKRQIDVAAQDGLINDTQKTDLSMRVGALERYPEVGLSWQRTLGVWIAAFFTLAIMSFLYRDNPFYKVAEAVVIGASAGYVMVAGFWTTFVKNLLVVLFPGAMRESLVPGLKADQAPDYIYIIPLIMIVLLLWRLAPKGGWISRWPLAFFIGVTAGFRLIGYLEADFLGQIAAGVIPLYVPVEVVSASGTVEGVSAWLTIWASFSNIVITLATLTGLVYFFFSVEHRGIVGRTAKVGIWFLMVAFGAMFGFTVMGRIALLSQRLEFMFGNWLDLIQRI